ncbi:hypothetical protein O9X98_06975 [Agrobacterium salinitolerans]|nr:hypothetical protein [Agrobacterium salinitolerans]
MTESREKPDPRVAAIIKELVAWDDQEFDYAGRPLKRSDPEAAYVCPCPDTALERAARALRDLKHWAIEGRRLDAERGLADLVRDNDREFD